MISNVQYCAVSSGSLMVEEEDILQAAVDDDDRVYWYYIMDPLMFLFKYSFCLTAL
jgi:hypothetical protein